MRSAISEGRRCLREDARAVALLYQLLVEGNTALMDAAALEAHHLLNILRHNRAAGRIEVEAP